MIATTIMISTRVKAAVLDAGHLNMDGMISSNMASLIRVELMNITPLQCTHPANLGQDLARHNSPALTAL